MCELKEELLSFLNDKRRTYKWESRNAAQIERRATSQAKMELVDEVIEFIQNGTHS